MPYTLSFAGTIPKLIISTEDGRTATITNAFPTRVQAIISAVGYITAEIEAREENASGDAVLAALMDFTLDELFDIVHALNIDKTFTSLVMTGMSEEEFYE